MVENRIVYGLSAFSVFDTLLLNVDTAFSIAVALMTMRLLYLKIKKEKK